MKIWSSVRSVISALAHRSQIGNEMDVEMRAHIEHRANDLECSGVPRAEAERRARLEFGGYEKFKEECREAMGAHFVETLVQDVRYGVRMLRKSPGFTIVAILTLALGIGANTAIFSIVDVVLLQPLPFQDASRLVEISGINLPSSGTKTLTDVSVYETGELNLAGAAAPERVSAAEVSQNFFELLRVHPIAGRTFLPGEEAQQHPTAAVIGYNLWRDDCNSDPQAVGKTIRLNGSGFTLVGIMPPGFEFPAKTRIWVTHPPSPETDVFGGNVIVNTDLARLRPGVAIDQAAAELRTMERRSNPKGVQPANLPSVTPLRDTMVSGAEPALLLLLAAVGLVLLIACANVANLVLARNSGRAREFAVRRAIGAGRGRLARQLLLESILLSTLSGSLGVLIGYWSVTAAKASLAHFVPLIGKIALDTRLLFFAVAVTAFSGFLTGLVPALQSGQFDLNGALKENARSSGLAAGWRSGGRANRLLCVAEIASALLLLMGASLLIRSFAKLLDVKPGFRTENLIAARVSLLGPAYESAGARLLFLEAVLDRTRALPGVRSAAFINAPPLAPAAVAGFYVTSQGDSAKKAEGIGAIYIVVSPGYFRTMGIPLLEGRDFTEQERQPSESNDDSFRAWTPGLSESRKAESTLGKSHRGKAGIGPKKQMIAIVSHSLAGLLWPGQEPLGKRFDFAGDSTTVIGVAADVRSFGLDSEPRPTMYFSMFQQTLDSAFLVAYAEQGQLPTGNALRGVVASVDKTEPISDVMTMDTLVSRSVADARFRAVLLGSFAALAFLLAIAGIYGVISYSVRQRTREIGIRMAFGADRGKILSLVLREGILLTAAGIAVGVGSSVALARLITHFLFGVRPSDPASFVAASLVMAIVALLACYIPARRATRVDPMVALRHE